MSYQERKNYLQILNTEIFELLGEIGVPIRTIAKRWNVSVTGLNQRMRWNPKLRTAYRIGQSKHAQFIEDSIVRRYEDLIQECSLLQQKAKLSKAEKVQLDILLRRVALLAPFVSSDEDISSKEKK